MMAEIILLGHLRVTKCATISVTFFNLLLFFLFFGFLMLSHHKMLWAAIPTFLFSYIFESMVACEISQKHFLICLCLSLSLSLSLSLFLSLFLSLSLSLSGLPFVFLLIPPVVEFHFHVRILSIYIYICFCF